MVFVGCYVGGLGDTEKLQGGGEMDVGFDERVGSSKQTDVGERKRGAAVSWSGRRGQQLKRLQWSVDRVGNRLGRVGVRGCKRRWQRVFGGEK
ncbi:hypothetical protein ACJRO7_029473 [Eucalyptus globulus]|uniref:Uncharacterized protein n=1 Tax=Eucalyptus globulus TaxID=34317 RepID=A0ABD3JBI4_EUCGL